MTDTLRLVCRDVDGGMWALPRTSSRVSIMGVVDTLSLTGETRRVPRSTEKIAIGLRSGTRYHVFSDDSIGVCSRPAYSKDETLCSTCKRFSEVTK